MIIRTLLLLVVVFCLQSGYSQTDITFEQYHTTGAARAYEYMPVVHFQKSNNWCAQARYNYEEARTFSLFAGKAFKGKRVVFWSLTPMLGVSLGCFKGLSAALNIDLEYNDFFLSAQTQYSRSVKHDGDYFLYSWSEAGYQCLNWLYAGVSFQHTQSFSSDKLLEPGVLVGFTFKKFTLPVYAFNPLSRNSYFIIGCSFPLTVNKKAPRVEAP